MKRACEILFLALIFGLPFEYYFRTQDQSLYSTLKLQLLLFLAFWIAWLAVKTRGSVVALRKGTARLLPGSLVAALLCLVVTQTLAAALAPEFRHNAIRAAIKADLGVILLIAAADLARKRTPGAEDLGLRTLAVLSLTGSCVALIGWGDFAGIGFFERIVEIFQPHRFWLMDRVRLHSTMEYPNTAGSFLAACLLASLSLVACRYSPLARRSMTWIWAISAALQASALTFTHSRGATGSAILGLALATWLGRGFALKTPWKWAAVACFAMLAAAISYQIFLRYTGPHTQGASQEHRAARFGLAADEETMHLSPGSKYRKTIRVRNDSPFLWTREEFGIGYRWIDLENGEAVGLREVAAIFQETLSPGRWTEFEVWLGTPPRAGEFLLIWFVIRRFPELRELENSFSPAIICSLHPSGEKQPHALSDKGQYYLKLIREERRRLMLLDVPDRWDLWHAALKMFLSRPLLGAGPDNFRLLKWKYMKAQKGDETILANSLYLEYLANSGIAGLASLLWLVVEFAKCLGQKLRLAEESRDRGVAFFGVAFFAAFLTHGLVDYFLKFTPAFLLFWLFMGVLCCREEGNDLERRTT